MLIRDFEPDDLVALGAIHAAARQRSFARLLPEEGLRAITASHLIEFWRDRLTHAPDQHRVLVAQVDHHAVGFALGVAHGPIASVDALVVDPRATRQGHGSALHDGLLEVFRGWSCRQAALWLPDGDGAAESFVERRGWTRTRDVDSREAYGTRVALGRWARSLVSSPAPRTLRPVTLRSIPSDT